MSCIRASSFQSVFVGYPCIVSFLGATLTTFSASRRMSARFSGPLSVRFRCRSPSMVMPSTQCRESARCPHGSEEPLWPKPFAHEEVADPGAPFCPDLRCRGDLAGGSARSVMQYVLHRFCPVHLFFGKGLSL